MPNPLASLRKHLAALGDQGRRRVPLLQRVPRMHTLLEAAARFGYGARGFVYLSVGLLTLLGAIDLKEDAVSTKGAIVWLAEQPLGRIWMILLAVGLAAFVMWRVLQSVFDADHEGTSRDGIMTRLGQGFSGVAYAALALTAFRLISESATQSDAAEVEANQERAQTILSLPYGHGLLIGVGLALFGLGIANIVRAWREDFTEYLACSSKTARRVAPLARAGYIARGLAYLPLAILIVLAGWNSRPSHATSFSSALDAVERQPGGAWVLAAAALGFMAFGVFSFIEARFRRIRPPRELDIG